MTMTILRVSVVCLVLLMKVLVLGRKNAMQSGPYRSLILNMSVCQTTTYHIERDPSMRVFMEVYPGHNNLLLRGNLTVLRETRHVKIKVKSFVWDGGRWKMTYLMSGITCQGMLLDLICKAINMNMFDREKCAFLKGYFSFSDMDVNKIQHIWTSNMEYGRVLWRSEGLVGTATYFCWDFETLVERA